MIDLRRVTGVDASAAAAFAKAERLAAAQGAEIVLTGASEAVRARLERGGVLGTEGIVSFEADLDVGLQRCEEALLEGAAGEDHGVAGSDGVPPGLAPYLDRVTVAARTVLLHQGEPPGDIYVLAEGRLAVETSSPGGDRVRLRTLRPGVVVARSRSMRGSRAPRTSSPRPRAWCSDAPANRSRGWRPRTRRWPPACTAGSPVPSPTAWGTPCAPSTHFWTEVGEDRVDSTF